MGKCGPSKGEGSCCCSGKRETKGRQAKSPAMEILEERFARGEIDKRGLRTGVRCSHQQSSLRVHLSIRSPPLFYAFKWSNLETSCCRAMRDPRTLSTDVY